MNQKILITDKVHSSLITRLQGDGHSVHYQTEITLDEVWAVLPDYDGIIINSKIRMGREMIDRATKLMFIARLGSGMEIVDIPYARSKGIRVINAPEGNCDAVGEHALGMLLMLANHLIRCDREVKSLQWHREKNRGFELMGKTIGIIGVGHTGKSLAKRLQGWNMKVLGYDKYVHGYGNQLSFIKESSFEDILKNADIISFHLPLTEETRYLCDTGFLERCKDGVIILNTSRGVVVDTQALIDGLQSGKVGGACLDVFENEKPNTYTSEENKMYQQLFAFENVVVSPHVAGWTHESLQRIADLIYERISGDYTMN